MLLYKAVIISGTENWQTGLWFCYEETFCKCVFTLHLKVIFRKDFENGHIETTIELKDLVKNLIFHSTLNLLHCSISARQFFLHQLPLLGPILKQQRKIFEEA